MFLRKYGAVLGCVLALLTFLPVTQALEGVGAELYYRAPDANGVLQVFRIKTDNTIEQVSQETSSVVAYDVAYDNTVAYVTARSLNLDGVTFTNGGPLDSQNLNLNDVAWSPDKSQAVVVAISANEAADPSEGVWLLDMNNQNWTLLLNSVRTNDASKTIYREVTWAKSGDRLLLEALFFESNGIVRYNFFTGRAYAYNIANTGNINENGYSRGAFSLDGTDLIISDVPLAPTGDGFIIDVNDKSRIVPMTGEAARYVSHAFPIHNGVAYFIRDFGNNITTSEVWQLGFDGTRTALGSIPNADLAEEVAWTSDGVGLVYLNAFDDTTNTGTAHYFVRVDDIMQERALPEQASRMVDPQWGPDLTSPAPTTVKTAVFTEPLFDYRSAEGTSFYSVRLQWNEVAGSAGYRLSIEPAIEAQNSFDSSTVAAQLGRMACGTTFNVSIAAVGADGSAGESSPTMTITTPPCDAEIVLPVNTPAPVAAGDSGVTATEEPGDSEAQPTAEGTPINPDDPNAPKSVTAAEPQQIGTFADGRPSYGVDISWASPGTTTFFYVQVDPPNNPNGFPTVVNASDPTVAVKIVDLECGTEYSLRVESVATDGITVLASALPVSITTPACP